MSKKLSFFLFFIAIFPLLFGQIGEPFAIDTVLQIACMKKDTLPVHVYPLPPRINTGFSEYNPVLMSDSTFYFTTMRHEGNDDFDNFFEFYWFMRLYRSKLTWSGYSKPEPMPAIINHPKYFTANYAFNPSQNRLFLTRCKRIVDRELDCGIWETTEENGKWKKPQMLNRRINLPGTTTTQPFFVEYEEYAVLYFISDRPKGFGGLDIWYTIWKDDRFSDPTNLGSLVNTPGDEITPFYDTATNCLYFSSNTHLGIGGYDIFYSNGALSDWRKPDNMGVPFNSENDDIYFSINKDGKTGCLSSNRSTNKSSPGDTCCYDIFVYTWHERIQDKVDASKILITDTVDVVEVIRNMLPITLYFQNDEPDPRSWDSVTTANYQVILSDYIALKDRYKEEYSKGLHNEKKTDAERQMEHFFRDSVVNGFLKLQQITDYLLEELKKGSDITIKISGYASALHQKSYNKRLTQRRISSFSNYLHGYGDGVFLPFLDNQGTTRLIIQPDPRGNEEALEKNISDNIHDQRNSIYSILASLERRITITEIKIKK
ncbi:MAG: hypothetical protein LBV02_02480 [Bacteroidales bacterium]|jgi:hypothetical protein|nr:hypothetical protein [Bacteroidales bacterium]